MNKLARILFAAAFATLSLSASAQLLWKVEGNGAKGASYIFGTHHVAPLSLMDSIPQLTQAIQGAEVMYGEVEMPEDLMGPEMQAATMKHSLAPADSTLTKVFTPAQVDSINTVLAKYSGGMLNVKQLDMLKPAVVSAQLAMMQSAVVFPGFDPTQQLDSKLQAIAKEGGKPVKGFETIDQQLEILMGAPIADQASSLMEEIREDDKSAQKARELAEAYSTQNIKAIEDLLINNPDVDKDDPMFKRLFDERNNAWTSQLRDLLPANTLFIAVGAGHLVGPTGLINSLREAGYTVTPVK